MENAPHLSDADLRELLEENKARYCERVRVKGAKAEPTAADETVLEPDEYGVLRPRELPKADKSDEFWQ
jgi:hypothetical protein